MKTPILLAMFAVATGVAAAAEPSVTLDVKPERGAVSPGTSAILQIEVAAKPAPKKRTAPLNLAIVLDRSGSMRGAKIEKARQAASVAVDLLGADDIFSLVAYDSEAEVVIPPGKLDDKRAAKERIEAIEPGSTTALYDGVQLGAKQLREFFDKEKVNRVILLSDGLANNGPSTAGELGTLGESLRKEGITVSTIGLGDDYNEDLMTALAEASHANYYYVADAEMLPKVFEEELGAAQSIVARKVRIRVELAAGIEAVEVIGEDGLVFEDGKLTIPVEDLSGVQKRRFLVSCRVPEGAEGSIELGTATVEYDDLPLGAAQMLNARANVVVAATREESEASMEGEVARNVAILRNRLSKEEAVRLADAGRPEEAAALLERQIRDNAALPAAAQSSAIVRENQVLGGVSRSLRKNNGLSRSERKDVEYQNYMDRKQKR